MAVTMKGCEQPLVLVDRGLGARLVDGAAGRQEGGLLAELTRLVPEPALEGEITDHLRYGKHAKGSSADWNARSARSKTVSL